MSVMFERKLPHEYVVWILFNYKCVCVFSNYFLKLQNAESEDSNNDDYYSIMIIVFFYVHTFKVYEFQCDNVDILRNSCAGNKYSTELPNECWKIAFLSAHHGPYSMKNSCPFQQQQPQLLAALFLVIRERSRRILRDDMKCFIFSIDVTTTTITIRS